MSNGAVKLTLAAAVATAAASLAYATAFGTNSKRRFGRHQHHESGQMHFDVPSEILQDECECKEEVILAVQLALEGECRRIHLTRMLRVICDVSYTYDVLYTYSLS